MLRKFVAKGLRGGRSALANSVTISTWSRSGLATSASAAASMSGTTTPRPSPPPTKRAKTAQADANDLDQGSRRSLRIAVEGNIGETHKIRCHLANDASTLYLLCFPLNHIIVTRKGIATGSELASVLRLCAAPLSRITDRTPCIVHHTLTQHLFYCSHR